MARRLPCPVERCPEGTDPFYCISSISFARFQRIDHGDVLNAWDDRDDMMTRRSKANLSDVSCAVSRAVFKEYFYRYGYAEDLDLGLRLMRDGYRIKLLGTTETIHGHTRTIGYYMRRSMVDIVYLNKIIGQPMDRLQDPDAANQILTAANGLTTAIARTRARFAGEATIDEFQDYLMGTLRELNNQPYDSDENREVYIHDSVLCEVFEVCDQIDVTDRPNYTIMQYITDYYMQHEMFPYFRDELERKLLSTEDMDVIYDCMIKRLAIHVGEYISRTDPDGYIHSRLRHLEKGI